LLNIRAWNEVEEIDALVQNTSITDEDGKVYRYADLCSKWGSECHQNDILDIGSLLKEYEGKNEEPNINYPVAFNPTAFTVYSTGHFLSGVKLKPDKFSIETAASVRLNYFVVSEDSKDHKRR